MREMDDTVRKNARNWDDYAAEYERSRQREDLLRAIARDPAGVFRPAERNWLNARFGSLRGLRVCVPSSGDNHAVFALALLGAEVTSCDISGRQLEAAEASARRLGIGDSVRFVRADTMRLEGLPEDAFDLVYTSNGVWVWLNDLPAAFRSAHRILKPGGALLACDVHPFQRPFDREHRRLKPYDATGPFEDEWSVNFHWRVQDVLNAVIGAGLRLVRVEELMPDPTEAEPFWTPLEDAVAGRIPEGAEREALYDLSVNAAAAFPVWLMTAAEK